MAWLIWKENHRFAEETVTLGCNVALQPQHMLKKYVSNDLMSMVARQYNMTDMWLPFFFISRTFKGKGKRESF